MIAPIKLRKKISKKKIAFKEPEIDHSLDPQENSEKKKTSEIDPLDSQENSEKNKA